MTSADRVRRAVASRLPERVHRVVRRVRFRLTHRGMRSTFNRFHRENYWASDESISGPGSTPEQTARLVEELPDLLRSLGTRSMLDIPCGDFAWMRWIDLTGIDYLGCDIVPDLIAENTERFGAPGVRFEVRDLTRDDLPAVDVILVRDCLVHLPNRLVWRSIRQIRASGSRWLLTTTHPGLDRNANVSTGRWRPLDLTAPPFSFPQPQDAIVEGCTEQGGIWRDKSLALWRIADLPAVPRAGLRTPGRGTGANWRDLEHDGPVADTRPRELHDLPPARDDSLRGADGPSDE